MSAMVSCPSRFHCCFSSLARQRRGAGAASAGSRGQDPRIWQRRWPRHQLTQIHLEKTSHKLPFKLESNRLVKTLQQSLIVAIEFLAQSR